MKSILERTINQNYWNAVFMAVFLGIVIVLICILAKTKGLPNSIGVFDFLILVFAAFRIIRLFVYDKITKWFRDLFLNVGSDGKTLVKPSRGPRLTMYELLDCPWCLGIWAGTVAVLSYYLFPWSWIILLILAVSGLASFIQIIANALGWIAERAKLDVQKP
jgi:hypothetical protein